MIEECTFRMISFHCGTLGVARVVVTKLEETLSSLTLEHLFSFKTEYLSGTFTYSKVASSNTSRLEAHAGFFRLLMNGICELLTKNLFPNWQHVLGVSQLLIENTNCKLKRKYIMTKVVKTEFPTSLIKKLTVILINE